jgi:hypothetical protein
VESRCEDLLPVEYFHTVFTVSNALHPLFLANRKPAYDLLFAAVNETLQEVALNPKRLGAKIGFIAVLHTWTQLLLFHPHMHVIIPGGGLDPTGTQWVSSKPGFFLPDKVLAIVFRGKLLSKLEASLAEGKLCSPVEDPIQLLRQAARKDWVVDSRPPFGGPEQVLKYVGRYTHRIAISNARLVSMTDAKVTFRWKDRANGNQQKLMTLEATEFLRRFVLHVLPKRYFRIRHYGFLSNSKRRKSVALCRELLATNEEDRLRPQEECEPPETYVEMLLRVTGKDVTLCPQCRKGHMVPRQQLPRAPTKWTLPWIVRPP